MKLESDFSSVVVTQIFFYFQSVLVSGQFVSVVIVKTFACRYSCADSPLTSEPPNLTPPLTLTCTAHLNLQDVVPAANLHLQSKHDLMVGGSALSWMCERHYTVRGPSHTSIMSADQHHHYDNKPTKKAAVIFFMIGSFQCEALRGSTLTPPQRRPPL